VLLKALVAERVASADAPSRDQVGALALVQEIMLSCITAACDDVQRSNKDIYRRYMAFKPAGKFSDRHIKSVC
jgi:hypothetical protein